MIPARHAWLLVGLAACKFSSSATGDGGTGGERMIDAAPDASPDAFDPLCFGSGPFYLCVPAMPAGNHTVAADDLDTTACDGTNQDKVMLGATPVCLISADAVSVPGTASVFGDLPLVILGVSSITIAGTVDAAAGFGNGGGPGSNPTDCDPAGIAGTYVVATAGSGGAGGSFGSAGGNGGSGNSNAIAGGVARPADVPPIEKLRGGCAGGAGGGVVLAGPTPGDGGGAVYLVSRGAITIPGKVTTNGAGGQGGGTPKEGGAGGGSGGMIVIHTQTLSLPGRLSANGGGGGGGAGQGTSGGDGSDPSITNVITPAPGGMGATGGAVVGGDGAAGATAAMAGPGSTNGGAGGGGGHGVIRILGGAQLPPIGNASPTPTN